MKKFGEKCRHCRALLVLLLRCLLWIDQCVGQSDNSSSAEFKSLYPFSEAAGDNVVDVGDDNCDGPVPLPVTVFNQRTLFVCTNGLVSLGRPLVKSNWLYGRESGVPFISANWYDFHTTLDNNSSRIYYRTMTLDNTTTEIAEQQRCRDLGFCTAESSLIFVVTWYKVAPRFSNVNRNVTLNTFQLILTSDSKHHFITFNYAQLPDRGMAGYDSRDDVSFRYVGTAVNFVNDTNVGRPGRWTFAVIRKRVSPLVSVRLAGSDNPLQGRLEVLYRGHWGRVCNDYDFDNNAAKVACYMMGFGRVGRYMTYNSFGRGNAAIWLYNVRCNGTEENIGECRHAGWGQHNCGYYEDVSIDCNKDDVEQVSVRLAGDSAYERGRLEVLYNGTWGTVSAQGFNNKSAELVCRMLRIWRGGTVDAERSGGGTGPIWLENIRCGGEERTISECWHSGWGNAWSNHSDDVWIKCYDYDEYDDSSDILTVILSSVICGPVLLVILCYICIYSCIKIAGLCVRVKDWCGSTVCRRCRRQPSSDENVPMPDIVP